MKKLSSSYWVTTSDGGKYAILYDEQRNKYFVLLAEIGQVLAEKDTRTECVRFIEDQQVLETVKAEDAKLSNRVKYGDNPDLEWVADRLLAADKRRGTQDEEYPILLDQQLRRRQVREVYPTDGVPDASLFTGIYGRVYNPSRRHLSTPFFTSSEAVGE